MRKEKQGFLMRIEAALIKTLVKKTKILIKDLKNQLKRR
jgi:hypothetical protein